MEPYENIDCDGKDLRVGDWVLVIAAPLSIRGMPVESLEVFSKAIGHTFQIEEFDELGCLHLDMYPKISLDSIYIEPFCVRRFRRYKKLSKAFQNRISNLKEWNEKPKLELEFLAYLKSDSDNEKIGLEIVSMGTGGGFSVWKECRAIRGKISVEAENPNAKSILESAKLKAAKINGVDKIEFH